MLEEQEWEQLAPLLTRRVKRIKEISSQKSCDLMTAKQLSEQEISDLHFTMTGYRETNINALWHHRLALFGPECTYCGHLFRTPKSRVCDDCGLKRDVMQSVRRDPRSRSSKAYTIVFKFILFIAIAILVLVGHDPSIIPYLIKNWIYIIGAIVAAVVLFAVAYVFIGNIYNRRQDTDYDTEGDL
jgi:hypothetical protein